MTNKKIAGKITEETITILGKEYLVRYTDAIGSCGNMGTADRSHQYICVDASTLAPQQIESTVLHEVIHMIDGELKLGLSEEAICRLEVGLYSAGYRRKCNVDIKGFAK